MFNDEVIMMLKDAAKTLGTTQGQLAEAVVQRTLASLTNDELRSLVGELPAPKKRGRKPQPKPAVEVVAATVAVDAPVEAMVADSQG